MERQIICFNTLRTCLFKVALLEVNSTLIRCHHRAVTSKLTSALFMNSKHQKFLYIIVKGYN